MVISIVLHLCELEIVFGYILNTGLSDQYYECILGNYIYCYCFHKVSSAIQKLGFDWLPWPYGTSR